MFVYNTTTCLEESVHSQWIEWIQSSILPETLKHKMVKSNRIFKVLADEIEGHSYAVQLQFDSIHDLLKYQNSLGTELLKLQSELFGDKALSFSTILKDVSLQ